MNQKLKNIYMHVLGLHKLQITVKSVSTFENLQCQHRIISIELLICYKNI